MATANLKELWGLLFEWPSSLTDEQIDAVLDAREELKEKIYIVWSGRLYCIECEKTHRLRKKELGGKTTEELLALRQRIWDERADILRTKPDEEIGDFFFEPSPTGSDEKILGELLRERGAS